MKLAVIPARGGSKRIPRKNIKSFGGKPIIAWSLEAAHHTGLFDRIIVSTDDEEIATIANKFGAEVPFVRPAELSDDFTGTTQVIAHAIQWHVNRGFDPLQICCVCATAPFLKSKYIQLGKNNLDALDADFAFSVTSYASPIQRALKLREDGRIEMLDPSQFHKRSQDLLEAYHDAGQFYWGTREAWLSGAHIFSSKSVPVFLPRYLVQDIDTPEDWQQAELMMESLRKSLKNG